MKVIARQAAIGAASSSDLSSVIVVATDAATRHRIAAALAEENLRASALVEAPTDVVVKATNESTIIVFVCNIDMPREIASLRRLSREARQPSIVVISPPATGAGVRRALDAGADALVFEPEFKLTLGTAVRAVAIGQSVVPRKVRASVQKPVLSFRESQVLTMVREGLTNAEIAEQLFLAESTIKSHVSSIFTKFGVRSRKEAAAVSIELAPALDGAPAASSNGPSGHLPP
jgi:DNA-binding NarL/FixJ family response regulator